MGFVKIYKLMRVRGFTSSQVLTMLAAPSTQMSWSYILSNTQVILFKLNQISKLRGTIWIGIELKISEKATSKSLRVAGMKGSLSLQTFLHVRPPWPTFDHPFKPYVIETTEGGSTDHFYSTNFSFGGGCNVFFYEKIHLTAKIHIKSTSISKIRGF